MSQEQKEFKNLFEAVSYSESHRQEEEKKPPLAIPQDAEMNGLSERARKMYEEIERRLEHAFLSNMISIHQFREFMSRPQNFSAYEWNQIQQQKKHVDAMIESLRQRLEASAPMTEEPEKKETAAPQKQKGARMSRRRWIDMH